MGVRSRLTGIVLGMASVCCGIASCQNESRQPTERGAGRRSAAQAIEVDDTPKNADWQPPAGMTQAEVDAALHRQSTARSKEHFDPLAWRDELPKGFDLVFTWDESYDIHQRIEDAVYSVNGNPVGKGDTGFD